MALWSWLLTETSRGPGWRTGITGGTLFTDWHGHLTLELNALLISPDTQLSGFSVYLNTHVVILPLSLSRVLFLTAGTVKLFLGKAEGYIFSTV